ncbi:Alpha/Beta hydrolase protein [Gilbertella persicaria]|uniref:Alpha/Beta hydrolase protein n=1 Tax=Gilbertella persicaria TaxID=101096 RepID=UPI00221EC2AB|nr:Alpha/Beta hydrolase protein [Gilbertella persicaria]KAI8066282.1 Alpha/Beta hydrolase protein [Gilbertella persicaria]
MIRTTEAHFNSTLPNGLNTELECIRLNLDPVHAIHRPLVVYISVYLATQLFNLVFLKWCWGFTSNDSISGLWGGPLQYIDSLLNNTCSDGINKITYWYRKPSTQTSKTPIVFIHGIGAGVICYAEWIYQLLCHFDRPVFLVELPYVAMHMVDAAPTAAETADEITRMLHTFGHTKAVYVSHSLGTAVTSWIMKLASNTVAGTVMIDPICFLLHYHHVAFNFVHRLPKRLMEYLLHYGASREMYISYYISRHFQWFESIYFVDQTQKVPLQNIAVFLSEKDGIVGSDQVYQYLLENDVNTYSMKGLEHAMFLINKKWKSTIIHQIDTISCKADSLK